MNNHIASALVDGCGLLFVAIILYLWGITSVSVNDIGFTGVLIVAWGILMFLLRVSFVTYREIQNRSVPL